MDGRGGSLYGRDELSRLARRQRRQTALIDDLACDGVAYAPFFPLGGFTPLQSTALSDVAARVDATPMQVALAWLLQRSPNILLIPETSTVGRLGDFPAAVNAVAA